MFIFYFFLYKTLNIRCQKSDFVKIKIIDGYNVVSIEIPLHVQFVKSTETCPFLSKKKMKVIKFYAIAKIRRRTSTERLSLFTSIWNRFLYLQQIQN